MPISTLSLFSNELRVFIEQLFGCLCDENTCHLYLSHPHTNMALAHSLLCLLPAHDGSWPVQRSNGYNGTGR